MAVVPAAVCVGAGYATGRLGLAAAGALCALSAAIALAPALDATYGRTDWRGAAARLEPTDGPRAIVVTPYMSRTLWRPYLPGLEEPSSAEATVQEIAAIGLATEGGYSAGAIAPPRSTPRDPCRGSGSSRSSGRRRTRSSSTARIAPRRVPLSTLTGLALTDEQPGVLRAARRGAGRRRR